MQLRPEAGARSPLSRRGAGLPGDAIYQSLSWRVGPAHPWGSSLVGSASCSFSESESRRACTRSPQRTPGRCAARSATASAQTGCCAPGERRMGCSEPGRLLPTRFDSMPGPAALVLTPEGCPAPTTISLPSSRPTSTWLRSLVTDTLRTGTFMGRGDTAGCSLAQGSGYPLSHNCKAFSTDVFISPCIHAVLILRLAKLNP